MQRYTLTPLISSWQSGLASIGSYGTQRQLKHNRARGPTCPSRQTPGSSLQVRLSKPLVRNSPTPQDYVHYKLRISLGSSNSHGNLAADTKNWLIYFAQPLHRLFMATNAAVIKVADLWWYGSELWYSDGYSQRTGCKCWAVWHLSWKDSFMRTQLWPL